MTWRAMSAQGQENLARHVIQRIWNPRFLSQTASCDVAGNVCRALPQLLMVMSCRPSNTCDNSARQEGQ